MITATSASPSKMVAGTSGRTMVSPSPITQSGDFWKALMGAGSVARAVLHVVHRHADDGDGPRQRRPDPHLPQRDALPAAHHVRQRRAPLGEARDERVDEVVGPGMRQILHRRGDVVHGIPLEHAQPELVEEEKFHGPPGWGRPDYTTDGLTAETASGTMQAT